MDRKYRRTMREMLGLIERLIPQWPESRRLVSYNVVYGGVLRHDRVIAASTIERDRFNWLMSR